jgi:hypothetical protein
MYVYVRNNPVNGVDQLGYETDPPPTEITGLGTKNSYSWASGNSDQFVAPIDNTRVELTYQDWAPPLEGDGTWTINLPVMEVGFDQTTALWGLVRAVGGLIQVIAGAAGASTGIGVVAVVHGLDDIQAGLRQYYSGNIVESGTELLGESVAKGLGASEKTAEFVGDATSTAMSFVGGVPNVASGGKGGQMAVAGSNAIVDAKKVAEGTRAANIGLTVAAKEAYVYNKDGNNNVEGDHSGNWKKPSSRHSAGKTNEKTFTKTPKNTVYDDSIDVAGDILDINAGKAIREGKPGNYTFTLPNGRIYKSHVEKELRSLIPVAVEGQAGVYEMSTNVHTVFKKLMGWHKKGILSNAENMLKGMTKISASEKEQAWAYYYLLKHTIN